MSDHDQHIIERAQNTYNAHFTPETIHESDAGLAANAINQAVEDHRATLENFQSPPPNAHQIIADSSGTELTSDNIADLGIPEQEGVGIFSFPDHSLLKLDEAVLKATPIAQLSTDLEQLQDIDPNDGPAPELDFSKEPNLTYDETGSDQEPLSLIEEDPVLNQDYSR